MMVGRNGIDSTPHSGVMDVIHVLMEAAHLTYMYLSHTRRGLLSSKWQVPNRQGLETHGVFDSQVAHTTHL